MTDIVERLRSGGDPIGMRYEAAAEIERLRKALSFYIENGTMGPADLRLATIEDCAQIAESTTYMSGAHIAAAIRAKKDKP